ncbi:MAG: ABC transporter substrate-binding protein [Bacillota bacterium]|nr:ABC transporter substrate-binding protein [Bacillota bacterium]
MKKIISIILALTLLALSGCGIKKEEATVIRIGGLKGATSIGLVKVMEDNANSKALNKYEFTIAGSADEITPKLIHGDLDIAAVPANLASVLYNNTDGAVKLLAINTLGVLYIVDKNSNVTKLSDLKGKTIYATGKGSAPEYTLRYILSKNGIDPDKDVTIEWKSEPTEVVALLAKSESGVAMMPQPYVTIASSQVKGLNVALDLTKEWNTVNKDSKLLTGVIVVRKDFAENHPKALSDFLKEYEASTKYVNSNVKEASQLVEKFNIIAKAAIAEKAIPYCNITFVSGDEMKTAMSGYLKVLYDQNPASIGGKLPGDEFYFKK